MPWLLSKKDTRQDLISEDKRLYNSKAIRGCPPDRFLNDDFIIPSNKGENQPLFRIQAYAVLNTAAEAVGIDYPIGYPYHA